MLVGFPCKEESMKGSLQRRKPRYGVW